MQNFFGENGMLLSQMKKPNGDTTHAPTSSLVIPTSSVDEVPFSSKSASQFLKSLSHEGRFAILCHLADGEKTVCKITNFLDVKQAAVSQQLSRLRQEGIVKSRRDGRNVYYSLDDPKTIQLIQVLHSLFCPHNTNSGRNE